MYTKEMVDKAVEHFIANPAYGEEYNTAPSDSCKERIAFSYCNSIYNWESFFSSIEEFKAERDKIESKLDIKDWKHLLKYSGNNPWHSKCLKKIKELEAAQNA